MDAINNIVVKATDLIATGGPIVGFLLILIESFIPALPLGVFVALNINAFGFFFGILISWIATCIGCFLSYTLFYKLSNKVVYKLLNRKTKRIIEKGIEKFKKIPLQNLVIIITLPFTPAFLINIFAGIAGMKKEKFLIALLIGKAFMIIFWGYIGKSFIESMTDIKAIIFISLTLLASYIISKFVSKKTHIE